MWTRALLKDNAKNVLRRSYWKVFLMCLVAALLSGGLNIDLNFKLPAPQNTQDASLLMEMAASNSTVLRFFLSVLLPLGVLFLLVVLALVLAWHIFFVPVLEVGQSRYMLFNRGETPSFSMLFSGFGPSYWNLVKGMFYINLRIFLYSLLLIIPGVIKSYQYKFVPYLLAENPDLDPARAAELSSIMSDGEKWNFFVLDLSFLGWQLLGALLFGIGQLFVLPYYEATQAELYAAMRAKAVASGAISEAELSGQSY